MHVNKSYYQKSYITFGPVDVLGGVASIQITKIANMCVNILNYRILQPKTAAKEVDFLDVLAKGLYYFVIIKIAYVYLLSSRPYNIGSASCY